MLSTASELLDEGKTTGPEVDGFRLEISFKLL
jgi:hypothetical protein